MPPTADDRKHRVARVERKLVWRGWYQAYDYYYICACGRRLKEHGEHTVTHFQPDIHGWAKIGREMEAALHTCLHPEANQE